MNVVFDEAVEALYTQCLSRANIIIPAELGDVSQSTVAFAAWRVTQIALQNRHRIPVGAQLHPVTGYPDGYLDEVLTMLAREGPRVRALKERDNRAWEEILVHLDRRVRAGARHYYAFLPIKTPFETAVRDAVQHCAAVLLNRLDSYPFDTPLEAWMQTLITRELSSLRRGADFRLNALARSLEATLTEEPDSLRMLDLLASEEAGIAWQLCEDYAVIRSYLDELPPSQREVIERQLQGEDTATIAAHMHRTRNAVYSLRRRAVRNLRALIGGD